MGWSEPDLRGVPRILHLHSTFSAGGKEVRCARLMNAWGPRLHHTIISAEPEAMAAAALIDPGVPVDYPQDFPSLKGKPTPARLARLARAMQGSILSAPITGARWMR